MQPDETLLQDIKEGQQLNPQLKDEIGVVLGADGLYTLNGCVVVPNHNKLRYRILKHFHDELGYFGVVRMAAHIKQFYYWKRMTDHIKRYCETCSICQRIKSDKQKVPGLLSPLLVPDRPWDMVGMDFVTQLPQSEGFNAVLTFTYLYSKMVHLVPTNTDVTAEQTA